MVVESGTELQAPNVEPRSRAFLIALFEDNNVGSINEKNFRDFLGTVMPPEFASPSDVWKDPDPRYLNQQADQIARGWIDYSQMVESDMSFGDLVTLTKSGTWMRANAANSDRLPVQGLCLGEYKTQYWSTMGDGAGGNIPVWVPGDSQCEILRKGIVYASLFSGICSTAGVGRNLYLRGAQSGSIGADPITALGSEQHIIGYVEIPDHIDHCSGTSCYGTSHQHGGKIRFDPRWAITGS